MKAKPKTPEATAKFKSEACFTARASKSDYNPAAQGGRELQKAEPIAYSECRWCGEVGDNHRIIATLKNMKIQNALVCHECSQVSHYDSDDSLSTAMPSDIEIEVESVHSGDEGPSKPDSPLPTDGEEEVANIYIEIIKVVDPVESERDVG